MATAMIDLKQHQDNVAALDAVDKLWSENFEFEREMDFDSPVGKVWALVRKALGRYPAPQYGTSPAVKAIHDDRAEQAVKEAFEPTAENLKRAFNLPPLQTYLTAEAVVRAHAQFGKLDRDLVRKNMGPNWPAAWDEMKPGEGIWQ